MGRKLYVQAWTARVDGAIEIDEDELRSIPQLKSLKPMIPMFTKIADEYKVVPAHLIADAPALRLTEEQIEVFEPWKD